jgi:hypothetical protein
MTNNASNPNSAKIIISEVETTGLRLELVDYVKSVLDLSQIASIDFQDFEKDIIINGLLEGLVKLKNRTDTDSSKRISKIIMGIIEQRYDILASKKNKYLKLRDLSWDKVFGIIFEIKIILKSKPQLLQEMIVFIDKVKEKCPFPYQYYWILHAKSKDPRAKLIPEEIFLLSYLQDYDKAMNKNTREFTSHYQKIRNPKKGLFGLRDAIKTAWNTK